MTTKKAPVYASVRTSGGLRVAPRTLADPDVAEQLAALKKQITHSKESSTQFLQKAGLLNESGKLAKSFGGR